MWRRGLLALLAGGVAAPGAAAHSVLLGAEPAEGSAGPPPAAITLRFNEPAQLTALRLFAPDGSEWPLRRSRDLVPRAEHRVPLLRDAGPGAWRAVWRAISADGHEIGGTIRFRVAAAP